MLGGKESGIPFHGEVDTANATAGVAFVLYTPGGVVYTLGANDRVVITAYNVVTDTTVGVFLQDGTGGAGKVFRKGLFAANSGMAGVNVEFVGSKGVYPQIRSSDLATINAQIEGRIFHFNG